MNGEAALAPLAKYAKELHRPGLLAQLWSGKLDSSKP
jgi:hypothetical protein